MKRYEAIQQQAGDVSVARLCAVLNVSQSGYYAWKTRPPSQRELANESLKAQITASGSSFGSAMVRRAFTPNSKRRGISG